MLGSVQWCWYLMLYLQLQIKLRQRNEEDNYISNIVGDGLPWLHFSLAL